MCRFPFPAAESEESGVVHRLANAPEIATAFPETLECRVPDMIIGARWHRIEPEQRKPLRLV